MIGHMRIFFLCLLLCSASLRGEEFLLKHNLRQAQSGDYIVSSQGKSITLLHIFAKRGDRLTIEEVSIPQARAKQSVSTWRTWFESGAPGNTSWVVYEIDIDSGAMLRTFSYTKNSWYEVPQAENFLGTLLNLELFPIPYEKRRKVGFSGTYWQPQMVVDGEVIEGVSFDAFKTRWPKDGSQLAGKTIEVYLPHETERYRSYFPHWLQISGVIGKAKLRIIDSGSNLPSPRQGFPSY